MCQVMMCRDVVSALFSSDALFVCVSPCALLACVNKIPFQKSYTQWTTSTTRSLNWQNAQNLKSPVDLQWNSSETPVICRKLNWKCHHHLILPCWVRKGYLAVSTRSTAPDGSSYLLSPSSISPTTAIGWLLPPWLSKQQGIIKCLAQR